MRTAVTAVWREAMTAATTSDMTRAMGGMQPKPPACTRATRGRRRMDSTVSASSRSAASCYSIGLQGEVYLPVPPERSGTGKVSITLQDRLVEADAITDETEKLPTGSRIRVVGLEGNNVLLVSKEWEGHQHADLV